MAGLALDGSNPDVSLLYDINGLAKAAPTWFDRVMEFVGEYGIMLAMVLVVLWCWWSVRRRGTPEDSVTAVAGLVWAPLGRRDRRARQHPDPRLRGAAASVPGPPGARCPGATGKTDFSFVSDHATIAMALAVGLFVANRKFGLVAIALALLEGFCRVYMGVHYPTDVIGGFALGTAVALLLAPLAMMLLTPLVGAVARVGAVGWLVRAGGAGADADGRGESLGIPEPSPGSGRGSAPGERDLAA